MKKIMQWGAAVSVAVALAGCGLLGMGGSATAPSPGPPVRITEHVAPSALVAVLNGRTFGPALSGLVTATARPLENLTVLQAGTPPRSVVSSAAPAPPVMVVAGRPAAPGKGSTSYLSAQYVGRLKHWQARGRRGTAGRDGQDQGYGVRVAARPGTAGQDRRAGRPARAAGSLAAESADAASVLAGLEEEYGNKFGGRRVLVLYSANLVGRPPAGELAGDTVLVVTPFLPTAAAASAAQADLLAAGAAQAAVVGPEVTGTQLAAAGLGWPERGRGAPNFVSAPVLFANASAALSPRAIAQLTALLPRLRRAGVTAVINGFASTPGTAEVNYTLSYDRASAVAAFFESHGVPATSLIIVGHGASDPVASGDSGLNRRVTRGHRVALTSGLPPPGQRSG